MDNQAKTKAQLIAELIAARQKIESLEAQLDSRQKTIEALRATKAAASKTAPEQAAAAQPVSAPTKQNLQKGSTLWAIEHEEDWLYAIINNLPDYIYAKDTHSRFVMNNTSSAQGIGAPDQESLIGKTDFDYLEPELAHAYYADEQRIIATGESIINQEERYKDIHGNECWFSTTKVPVRDANENIIGLVGISRDITEAKQIQEAIAVSRDTLQQLIQQLPIGVQIFDTTGLCIGVNHAHQQIFGFKRPEDVVGHFNLFTDPLAEKVGTQAGGLAALSGETVHLPEIHFDFSESDTQFNRHEGKRIVAVTFFPVRNKAGHVTQIVALNQDITERKAAETALRQSEERYRTLVEQLPAITYVVEFSLPESRTVYISPQVQTLLGYSPEEWLAQPNLWIERIYPDDREEVVAEVRRADRKNKSIDLEYRVVARNNQVLWFRNKSRLHQRNNQVLYSHGVMFDITKQKRLEEQLRHAQKMEAVGQMAGGIAHNFNNVLTALIGHTELALEILAEDHPVRHDLKSIKRSARRAADLTQQLLVFTRHQNTHPEIFNLNDLVADTDKMLQQLLVDTIDSHITLEPDVWPIKADMSQIEQVLVNLIVNARDAMPAGGQLLIETKNISLEAPLANSHDKILPGDYVLLSVLDTGNGIPPEIQPHIFEPFFTTKEVGQGTGLGLSTCLGIVQQNKGYITFESKPQQGTAFRVYLPRFKPPNKQGALPVLPQHRAAPPPARQTILLVEDSTMVRQMTARVLTQRGYQVVFAANGQEALDLIKERPDIQPTLLITDISMPQLSGDKLAIELRRQFPQLKILFISGYPQTATAKLEIEEQLHPYHSHAVLPKPFTPEALLNSLTELLTNKPVT